MSIAPVGDLGVEGEARVVGQGLKKFSDQFGIEISDLPFPQGEMIDQMGASRKIYMNGGQALIHGNEGRSIPSHPFFPTPGLLQSAPQADAYILDSMVKIHRCIALRLNRQVKESMGRKQAEHMIQEGDGGRDLVLAQAIQIQVNIYRGLFGPAGNLCFPFHEFFLFVLIGRRFTQINADIFLFSLS